jgi:DNA helicase-2/ATP-dependent DNA helicase PcrA
LKTVKLQKPDFLNELNKAQREAVVHYNGPSLVIAGPGSGKTRVLTYRVSYLLSKGVPARSILALTFTNKAAKEMKDRIIKIAGFTKTKTLWMGTFHSIFAKILRIESKSLGYPSNYTIYDTIDSKNVVKSVISDLDLDDQVYRVNDVLNRISTAKNSLITAQAYLSNPELTEWDKRARTPRISDIYKLYAARCFKAKAMDFDDLLLNTNILFRNFPEILKKYQRRFNFILVDEYQDTNFSQYLIVNKLADKHKNVCVVGDDAQSIYSFRGAKIENILNFRKDYPNHTLFKLEQNYRSTKKIVKAANSLIINNKDQIHKTIWSKNESGEKIKVISVLTDTEEGFVISNSILDLKLTQQLQFQDFAILYRTNAQSRIFEESLRKRNIPYKVYGGISFYQRKEIKDLLAYFRLIINHNDEEAIKRIINYPTRGIGKITMNKLDNYSNIKNINLWDIIKKTDKHSIQLNVGIRSKIQSFVHLIKDFSSRLKKIDAYDLAFEIATTTGILKELYTGKSPEEISKYQNIQELLNGIKEFTIDPERTGRLVTLEEYMENVALLTDADKESEEDKNKVTIMTAHSAKGLEFEYVYIAGAEEDLFPSHLSTENIKDIEEERRLFYVAITRAKKQVTITYTQSRFKWGSFVNCTPSRFIREIDNEYLDYPELEYYESPHNIEVDRKSFYEFPEKIPNSGYKHNLNSNNRNKKLINISEKSQKRADKEIFQADDPRLIQTGMDVEHLRFGTGKVLNLEGEFPNTKATVFFQNHGQKHLLLKFAKLRIVNY